MRPLRLILEAFGPFAERQEIDFRRFQELEAPGPILIAGPTGSGKTMIFDAMAYALYGESSGSHREVKTLRSDFAPPELETRVCLDFELTEAGKMTQYRLLRQPQQELWSPRLQRLVNLPAQVVLTLPDGTQINKINEVSEKIRELIGLDAKQFKQTALLAQGEFQKLLYASSKDRVEIFRTLFATDQARDLQEALQLHCERRRQMLQSGREALYRLFAGLPRRPEIDAVLAEWQADLQYYDLERLEPACALAVHKLETELSHGEAQLGDLNARREGQEAELLRLREGATLLLERGRLDERAREEVAAEELRQRERDRLVWLGHYQKLQTRLFDVQTRQEVLEGLADAKSELEERLKLSTETRKALEEALERRPAKQEELASLRAEQTRLDDIQTELEESRAERGELAAARAAASEAQKALQAWRSQHEILQDQVERRRDLEGRRIEVERRQSQLKEEDVQLALLHQLSSDLAERYGEWVTEAAKLRELEQERTEVEAEIERLAAELQAASEQQDAYWAAHLARGLVLETPCPVCGSVEHPDPARTHESERGEGVDALRLALITAQGRLANDSAQKERLAVEIRKQKQRYDKSRELLQERFQEAYPESLATPFFNDVFAAIPAMVLHLPAAEEAESLEAEAYQEDLGQLHEAFAKLKARTEMQRAEGEATIKNWEASLERLADAAQLAAWEAEGVSRQTALDGARAVLQKYDILLRERLERLSKRFGESLADEETAVASLGLRREALSRRVSDLEQQLASWAEQAKQLEREEQDVKILQRQLRERREAETVALEASQEEILSYARAHDLETATLYEAGLTATALAEEQAELRAQLEAAELEARALREARAQNAAAWAQLALGLETEEELRAALERVEEELAATIAQRDQLAATQQVLAADRAALVEAQPSLRRELSELAAAEEDYQAHRYLQQLAMGQMAQSAKIDFETFVQTFYFQQVLALAARRFSLLTEARYELRRRTEAWDLRKRMGLDLDVYDRWTGKVRPVSTLSGGESFKAALAFALALSDLAGANAGGKKIGCLFIDEGFGTLDAVSLNSAYECLLSISDESRVVAVISHVPELAERLQKQIRLRSEADGSSRIELVY